jgi:resuscitation-promoting factor RpfB
VRRSLQLSLFAVVLLMLVGGLAAWFLAQKSVTLTIDGQSRTVHTYADTVSEVLDDEGLRTASHDVVLPAPSTTLASGDTVVVNRARPLQLTVDGVSQQVWVTAQNVDEALAQLGLHSDGLVLSASRSQRVPLSGMQLSISTPKTVVLIADGQQRTVTTTAGTASALLAEQGITLGPEDRTSLQPDQALLDQMRLQVFRVTTQQITVTAPIPHKTVQTQDPDILVGQQTVTQPGVDGQQATVYRVTYTDGVETGRQQVSTAVAKQPVDQLVAVGTKPKPTPPPAPAATAAPSTSDGLNWAALAKCESGGNPRAVNPAGYYGLYQFSLSTWHSVGGSGNPIDASPDEQTARAQMLYARGGAGQWGCGRHLSD